MITTRPTQQFGFSPYTLPSTSQPEKTNRTQPSRPNLARLVSNFDPISLAEMDSVALQDRTDTKYLFHVDQLSLILMYLMPSYRVLDVDGIRLNKYQTLYFDTPDFALYHQHHAGQRNRYKVRSRKYNDAKSAFLEVKFKRNTNRTIKRRIPTPSFVTELAARSQATDFLRDILPTGNTGLCPRLSNTYSRITLVSTARQERLTFDLDLAFSANGTSVALPDIVIAEVKQSSFDRTSDFVRLMRQYHIHSSSFSKYCVGASLLYHDLKHNNFNKQLRLLQKLAQGGYHGSH